MVRGATTGWAKMDPVDAHPINTLLTWLDGETRSIGTGGMAERTATNDLSDLKRRIAAGEYRLDAHAIAEAMFGAADRAPAAECGSEVLEPGDVDGPSGRVDQF